MNNYILYEDDYILICKKPSGMPSQDDKTGDISLYGIIREQVKSDILVMLQRLDRPVLGIVLFAKTKECASFFADNEKSRLEKTYCGIICGKPEKDKGTLTNILLKNERKNISQVVKSHPKGKKAILHYEITQSINSEWGMLSEVLIRLVTGRHHQIRVQLSYMGHGLVGDTKYNQEFTRKYNAKDLALFCKEISFIHPKTLNNIVFSIEAPSIFPYNLFLPSSGLNRQDCQSN